MTYLAFRELYVSVARLWVLTVDEDDTVSSEVMTAEVGVPGVAPIHLLLGLDSGWTEWTAASPLSLQASLWEAPSSCGGDSGCRPALS